MHLSHLWQPRNVFEVREDSKQLIEKKRELFHLVVANILFIMKSSRPVLEMAVSFLTSRVSKSDIEHWKIDKDIEFCLLHTQRNFFLATNIDKIFTWVDASYALHHDMKIQTGGVVSIGLGVTHCILSKQKLNMKR